MRWAVVILGCLGFAGATQAAERWPEGPCRNVQQQESYLVKEHAKYFATAEKTAAAADLATRRLYLLVLLGTYCGVDVRAKIARDRAAMDVHLAQLKSEANAKPRYLPPLPLPPDIPDITVDLTIDQPPRTLNCTTLKLDRDLATTNCN